MWINSCYFRLPLLKGHLNVQEPKTDNGRLTND